MAIFDIFKTIRERLLASFLVLITLLLAIPLLVSLSLNSMIVRYEGLVNELLSIYQIGEVTEEYSTAYINAIQNIGVERQEQNFKEVSRRLANAVDNLEVASGTDLKISAQGTVNIVKKILELGDEGFEAAKAPDPILAYDVYTQIMDHSFFVKDGVGKVAILELEQINLINATIQRDRNIVTISSLLVIGMVFIASFIFASSNSKTLIAPLMELSNAVKQFGGGKNYQLQISDTLLRRNDEVGLLAKAFEEMRLKIVRALEEQAKVQHDLKLKNDDLVRMNEMMVGGEIKMIELKTELDDLKKIVLQQNYDKS